MIFNIIFFGSLIIAFVTLGVLILKTLNLVSDEVYAQNKCKIIFAIYLITQCFLIRVIFHSMKLGMNDFSDHITASIEDNSWFAPLIYTFFIVGAELIPIGAQLISFTFIMRKNSLKHQIERSAMATSLVDPESDRDTIALMPER